MKHIVIIEPAFSGLSLLPAAKRLKLKVSIFTANRDDRKLPKEYLEYVDNTVIVNTNDASAVCKELNDLNIHNKIDAVIPGSEYHTAITAKAAAEINVLGNPVETAEALRNKAFLREILSKNKSYGPKYAILTSTTSLEEIYDTIGPKVIVKPVNMSGSLNVKKAVSIEEFRAALNEIAHSNHSEMENNVSKGIIVEEYIEGPEYSVEGILNEGKGLIVAITEKRLGSEPYFVEEGHIVEADLDSSLREKIKAYVLDILNILKLNAGAFHLELRLHPNYGPIIIEIAGRCAGDCITDLVEISKNIDLSELAIKSYLNESIKIQNKINHFAGIQFYRANTGLNLNKNEEEKMKMLPGFYKFKHLVPPDEKISSPETFHSRVAYAIFSSETHATVSSSMQKFLDILDKHTEV